MLDTFEILTTSGVVLWSRSYGDVNPSIINNFITDVFIEEKGAVAGAKDDLPTASNPPYKADQHTLKWTLSKEIGVIFVVSTPCRIHSFDHERSLLTQLSAGCISIAPTLVLG
jgi:signal recognition particle receptor subunit alpha